MKTEQPSTPAPRKVHRHECHHSDIEVLLEDVRQSRKRRWWLLTVAVTVLVGSLGTMGWKVFETGQRVGVAQAELHYMKASSKADRLDIQKNSGGLLQIERSGAITNQKISETLIRLDNRLGRIEEAIAPKKGRRGR